MTVLRPGILETARNGTNGPTQHLRSQITRNIRNRSNIFFFEHLSFAKAQKTRKALRTAAMRRFPQRNGTAPAVLQAASPGRRYGPGPRQRPRVAEVPSGTAMKIKRSYKAACTKHIYLVASCSFYFYKVSVLPLHDLGNLVPSCL